MRLIALLSGGKDSMLAMHVAIEQGHEVVVLGNLYPSTSSDSSLRIKETDSYMYQSVGQEFVPLIAECLELPLERERIGGKPLLTNTLDYSRTESDEVEDLHALLLRCKEKYAIEGVCSGAIFSDYQRLRLEEVCRRLDLVSVAPLWHMPQSEVIDTVIQRGICAILLKTATDGLDERHLMKDLTELKPVLSKLARTNGINMAGEGGEFESMTLDAPLFKSKKLQVKSYETTTRPPQGASFAVNVELELVQKGADQEGSLESARV